MSAFWGNSDIARALVKLLTPHFRPRAHTIRGDDLIPPLDGKSRVRRLGNCKRPPGEAASCLTAERPGVSGDGEDRSTVPTLRPYRSKAIQHLVIASYALV